MPHPNNDKQCVIGKQLEAGLTKEQIEANMREWEDQCIKRHGWYAHYVSGNERLPAGVNFHTHGFELLDRHPDFQIVVNCQPEVVHAIFSTLYQRVKQGEKFTHCQRYDGIINGLPVLMLMAYESDRQALRVILPDAQGNFDKARMSSLGFQYDDVLLTERVTLKLCKRVLSQLYFRIGLSDTLDPRLTNLRNEWLQRGFEARQEMERLINIWSHESIDQNIDAQVVNHYLNMIREFEQVKARLNN